MKNNIITLSEPIFDGNELKYLSECVRSGWITSGKFINKFETKISNYINSKYAISCINWRSCVSLLLVYYY